MIPVPHHRDIAMDFPCDRELETHTVPILSAPENRMLSQSFLCEGLSAGRTAFFL